MSYLKTAGLAVALTLGVSAFALAQTSTTSPSNSAPKTPSATGSSSSGSTTTAPSGTSSTQSTTSGSGSSTAPMKMTESDVKKKLEGEGYSQVSDVKAGTDGWAAKAMKGGKQVTVAVDQNGKVSEMR